MTPWYSSQPASSRGVGRRPGERGVVAVAHREEPARAQHPAHLAQRGDRVAEVLEHLVGVDDVERPSSAGERVHVAERERDVADAAVGPVVGLVDHVARRVDPDDPARRDRRARSRVMVPGPQPTSSEVVAGRRWARR